MTLVDKVLPDGTLLHDCRPDLLNIGDLWARGWSLIPLRARDKRPAVSSWTEYQKRPAEYAQLERWFNRPDPLNVGIVTGAVSAAQNIVKCVRRCGLDVADLILQPLASSLAVLSEDEKELGVALVDIGGGTTDVAIFREGAIRHTAVIPIAGDQVTGFAPCVRMTSGTPYECTSASDRSKPELQAATSTSGNR